MALELSDYWTVEFDAPANVVHVRRTAYAYPNLEVVVPSFEMLVDELARVGREGRALMIDFRGGPTPRNDDAFEELSRPYRTKLFEGFAAGGVLVRTAAGMMQLTRTSREDGFAYAVHDDEAGLREYLAGELAKAAK